MRALSRTLVLFVLLILALSQLSLSADVQSKRRQLEEVKRRLRHLKVRLRYQSLRESDVYRQLQEVWRKVSYLDGELRKIEQEVNLVNSSIEKLERKLSETQRELEELQTSLRLQVIFLFRNYGPWLVMGILGERDMDAVLDRIYLLKLVISQESKLLTLIAQKQRDIELMRDALKHRRERLNRYRALLSSKRRLYASLLKRRQELLEEIRRQKMETQRELKYYEEISKKIRREIMELIVREQMKGKLTFSAGKLIWPTTSTYVTSYFGYRWHPVLGGYRFHSGIDIANYYGEPVYAAADGVVIFAGWLDGYGYAVIIDHGSGVSTLYAHCSRLLVRKGDVVTAGQVIAKVGSTGRSTGPHLHFEVRIGGRPVNPLKYLYR